MPTPTNENTSKSTWLPERCRFFIATSLRKLLIRPDECAALARSAFPVGIRSLSKNWLDRFLIFANSLPLMQRDVNIVADRFSIRRGEGGGVGKGGPLWSPASWSLCSPVGQCDHITTGRP